MDERLQGNIEPGLTMYVAHSRLICKAGPDTCTKASCGGSNGLTGAARRHGGADQDKSVDRRKQGGVGGGVTGSRGKKKRALHTRSSATIGAGLTLYVPGRGSELVAMCRRNRAMKTVRATCSTGENVA